MATATPPPAPSADARLLDALRGVHWPARRAVRSGISGSHHSRMRGVSAEFTEYRPYRQGDDPRRLDWKLLARSDRAFIRLAIDRAVLPTSLVVDASASMAFPPDAADRDKWAQARRIALGLAAVARADGDPIGLMVAGGSAAGEGAALRTLAPRSRRGVLAEIARVLGGTRAGGSAALAAALAEARTIQRLVVLTDFLGDADGLLRVAREHVVGGGEVYAVHIIADQELDPPRRPVTAVDPEDRSVRRALTEDTRDEYRARLGAWCDAIALAWRAAGAHYALVPTGEAADRAVRRITGGNREARSGGAEASGPGAGR